MYRRTRKQRKNVVVSRNNQRKTVGHYVYNVHVLRVETSTEKSGDCQFAQDEHH